MTAAEKSWTIGYWEICLRTIKNAVIFQLPVIIVVVYDLVERYCLYTLFLNPWKEKMNTSTLSQRRQIELRDGYMLGFLVTFVN